VTRFLFFILICDSDTCYREYTSWGMVLHDIWLLRDKECIHAWFLYIKRHKAITIIALIVENHAPRRGRSVTELFCLISRKYTFYIRMIFRQIRKISLSQNLYIDTSSMDKTLISPWARASPVTSCVTLSRPRDVTWDSSIPFTKRRCDICMSTMLRHIPQYTQSYIMHIIPLSEGL